MGTSFLYRTPLNQLSNAFTKQTSFCVVAPESNSSDAPSFFYTECNGSNGRTNRVSIFCPGQITTHWFSRENVFFETICALIFFCIYWWWYMGDYCQSQSGSWGDTFLYCMAYIASGTKLQIFCKSKVLCNYKLCRNYAWTGKSAMSGVSKEATSFSWKTIM